MTTTLLTIGELAERTGLATSALRYYEELGLLAPSRRISGQRRYEESAVAGVGIIRFLRETGFTLTEIRELTESRTRSPKAWHALAQRKLVELDERIVSARVAQTAIEHAIACPKDDVLDCPNFWRVVGERAGAA